jgi:hypothetical protein
VTPIFARVGIVLGQDIALDSHQIVRRLRVSFVLMTMIMMMTMIVLTMLIVRDMIAATAYAAHSFLLNFFSV